MKLNTKNLNRRGIAMTEYLIILAIVAIGSILITNLFGNQVRWNFNRVIQAFNNNAVGVAETVGQNGDNEAKKTRGFDNFSDGVNGAAK